MGGGAKQSAGTDIVTLYCRYHDKTIPHPMNTHWACGARLLLTEPEAPGLLLLAFPATWVCQKGFFSRHHHLSLSPSHRGQWEEVAERPPEATSLLPPAVLGSCSPGRAMTSDTSPQS